MLSEIDKGRAGRSLPVLKRGGMGLQRVACFVWFAIVLAGCTHDRTGPVSDHYADFQVDPPSKNTVSVCHAYTCKMRTKFRFTDADIDEIYRRARFTVFPSLYEGWGLPVAESLAHGTFCIASPAGAIPEVAGDLVDYVDPWDVPGWAARIAHYLDRPDTLAARVTRIRTEYAAPTWADSASQVLDAARALAPE